MRTPPLSLLFTLVAVAVYGCDSAPEVAVSEAVVARSDGTLPAPPSAQDSAQALTIALTVDSADYYPWIEQLITAPTEWLPEIDDEEESVETVRGTHWRFIVTRSEIYVSIYLEQVSFGMEGCCMKLALVRAVEEEDIARHFRLRGELSRLENLIAVDHRSFRFVLHGVPLKLIVLSPDSARVERVSAP
jgi:hypothetical protein